MRKQTNSAAQMWASNIAQSSDLVTATEKGKQRQAKYEYYTRLYDLHHTYDMDYVNTNLNNILAVLCQVLQILVYKLPVQRLKR